jgi:hypothetical protein
MIINTAEELQAIVSNALNEATQWLPISVDGIQGGPNQGGPIQGGPIQGGPNDFVDGLFVTPTRASGRNTPGFSTPRGPDSLVGMLDLNRETDGMPAAYDGIQLIDQTREEKTNVANTQPIIQMDGDTVPPGTDASVPVPPNVHEAAHGVEEILEQPETVPITTSTATGAVGTLLSALGGAAMKATNAAAQSGLDAIAAVSRQAFSLAQKGYSTVAGPGVPAVLAVPNVATHGVNELAQDVSNSMTEAAAHANQQTQDGDTAGANETLRGVLLGVPGKIAKGQARTGALTRAVAKRQKDAEAAMASTRAKSPELAEYLAQAIAQEASASAPAPAPAPAQARAPAQVRHKTLQLANVHHHRLRPRIFTRTHDVPNYLQALPNYTSVPKVQETFQAIKAVVQGRFRNTSIPVYLIVIPKDKQVLCVRHGGNHQTYVYNFKDGDARRLDNDSVTHPGGVDWKHVDADYFGDDAGQGVAWLASLLAAQSHT